MAMLLVLSIVSSAFAQNTIHIPADQPTIQAGIDAASNGDTVLVAPGTYYENIDFKGKAITVTSSAGAAATIIDGRGTSSTVIFQNHEARSSVIAGFTIRGGGAVGNITEKGSGIDVISASPTIRGNIISNNGCHGVDVEFSAPLIQNNTISNTTSNNGAYCDFNGSGVLLVGNPDVSGAAAGGLRATLISNTIEQNLHAVAYDGGGIMIWANEGAVIENNIIRNNATTGQGGAIASYNSVAMSIVGNLIYGNSATDTGASLSLHPPEATLGQFIGVIANNTIFGNTFTGTVNPGYEGAGDVFLEGNLGQYAFVNNIVFSSMSLPALVCGTTYNYLSLTPLVVDHNDIYNGQGPAYGGSCPDQTGSYGNISLDPQFVNAGAGQFGLNPGSPAIDTGNNSIVPNLAAISVSNSTDLSGAPRIQDATGKGYPIIDMGAYEEAGQQNLSPTTILLKPSAYQVTGGSTVTLTATVASAAGIPAGMLDFQQDGRTFTSGTLDPSGKVTVPSAALAPGVHAFSATYAGQGTFPPSLSVKIYVLVAKYVTGLKITSSVNPSSLGQLVTFVIQLTSPDGGASGPVVVSDSNTTGTLATLTPDPSGSASFTTSSLGVGTHPIQAIYSGDATHAGSSAVLAQVVSSGLTTTTTSLTSSANPAPRGNPVTFTATVQSSGANAGVPGGTVTFSDGATVVATQILSPSTSVSSVASFASTLVAGNHTITATYNPTPSFSGSAASLSEQILGLASSAALSSSQNPSTYTQTVTFSATVTPTSPGSTPLTGSVSFFDATFSLGSVPVDTTGHAAMSTAALSVGTHSIMAVYSGDANYSGTTTAILAEVIQPVPLPADFTITLATPNITIRTQHHTTTTVTLASMNGFTDTLAISCANLPQYLTCRPTPASTSLTANGSTTVSLYLDTDSVLGYARNTGTSFPSRVPPITWAFLFAPLTLLGCTRSRRHGKPCVRLLMFALAVLPVSLALAGCGELIISAEIPPSVAPGTYTIPITATGAVSGISHTAQLTLQVTP